MKILEPGFGGRSWLKVVSDSLLLVGVSITARELGEHTCGEVLEAQRWAVAQNASSAPLPMPRWLLDREDGI